MILKKQRSMSPEVAEALAIQALTFIGQDPTELGRFLALTGIGPAELRRAAHEPGFLTGLLDHILGHEPTLIAFAKDAGVEPFDVALARQVLGGTQWERELP
jgi:hypothetical protein